MCNDVECIFIKRLHIAIYRVADFIQYCKLYEIVNKGKQAVLTNPLTLPPTCGAFEPTFFAN